MGKKVKKKARRKVKMQPAFGWVYVGPTGQALPSWTYAETETACNNRASKFILFQGAPRPVITVEDTPANRKRLGVKRG